MNNILQWQPEKTRIWGASKIENIHRLREDLEVLSAWIKTKADAGALGIKADLARVTELETAVGEARAALESSKQHIEQLTEEWREQSGQLGHWAQSAETSSAQCKDIEQMLRGVQNDVREVLAKASATGAEQIAQATRVAEEAKSAVEAAATLAQSIQNARSDCEANAQETRNTRLALETRQTEIGERLDSLLRQAEDHATAAAQNAQATSSASEQAAALKTECEGLLETLRFKNEELTSTGHALEQDLSALASKAQEDSAKAADFAREAQQALGECQTAARITSELRASSEAGEQEVQRRLSRVEQMLTEAERQSVASRDHLQSCGKLQERFAEAEARIRTLVEAAEQHAKEARNRMARFQETGSTFRGRLKWLFLGSGAL
jgi:chromosome segregation ATPase